MSYEKNRKNIVDVLNHMYPGGIGCEVGVLRGDFSKYLLENWNCEKLYSVDAWEDYTDYDEKFHEHNTNYKCTVDKLKEYSSRIVLHKGFSDKVVENFEDAFFDFIYIDANHSYEGCKKDLELYWDKLKPNGIIMGDDYHLNPIEILNFNNNDAKPCVFGVNKAVNEFIKEKKKIINLEYTGDWMYANGVISRNFVIQKN